MKLTVCFGDSKVVVPCGSGALSIRDLAFSALKRVKHTFPKLDARDRIVVHSLTSARDGGILDWDDSVCDVLDDRELVVAHYSIATLTNCTSSRQARNFPSDQLFPHLCTPLIVDPFCERWADALFHSDPKSTEVSGSSESGSDHHRVDLSVTLTGVTYPRHQYFNSIQFSSVADESNSSSSLSLNMSANSLGVDPSMNTHVWHLVGSELETVGKSSILSECGASTRNRNPPGSCVNKATETENIAYVTRAAAPFCTISSELCPLRFSPPSTEVCALKGRSKEYSLPSLQNVSASGFSSIFSTLDHLPDYVATNCKDEDNVGASLILWNGSEPSTTSSVTYVHGTSVDWHLPPFPHTSRETSSLSSFGDTSRSHGSYDMCCFSTAPLPLSPSLPSTVPNELRTRLDGVENDLLNDVVVGPYCGKLQRPHSAASDERSLRMLDESPPFTSDAVSTKVADTVVDCSSAVPCTSTTGSSLFSLNNTEPSSTWMLPTSPDSPQDVHTSMSSPDTFTATMDPPSPLCNTVPNSGSRPLFCSLTVSTILEEEEEEYSVDYDQSIPASPTHRNHRPTDQCPRILDDLDGGCGNLEEDYPLLRPDYFISLERPERINNIIGLTERFGNTLSVNPNKTTKDNLADIFKPTQSSTTLSPSSSATKAFRCLQSNQAPDSLLSSSLTPTLDCGVPSHSSDCPTSASCERAKERSLGENTQPENVPMDDTRSVSTSGTVIVRLVNTKPGENLGIQIKPVYVHSVKTSTENLFNPCTTKAKIESGLEVHNVLPNGRVARDRCLSVGDHILGINGVSLIGVPFEKGRDLFQAALSQKEFTLEVLPLSARLRKLTGESVWDPSSSATNILRTNTSVESEPRIGIRQDRPAPPPPPRRSPNTVLTNPTPGVDSPVLSTLPLEAELCATISSTRSSVPSEEPNVTQSVPPTGLVPIYLQKGTSGLGFSLTSRDLPDRKGRAIYVKSILPDGAARVDGRLRAGDRLVQVGDLDVDALGQARTVAWLRERPTNSLVRLLIWRPGEDNPASRGTNPGDSTPSMSANRMPVVQLSDTCATKSNSQRTSTSSSLLERLSEDDLYKIHLIDSSQYLLMELDIPLPAANAVPSAAPADVNSVVSSFRFSPVTLGVSVSVRPFLSPSHRGSRSDKLSTNAVFVRTLIEGGPAHKDGRLQVGDRLLTIDGEPLCGLSGADALVKLKSVIARGLATRQSCVRLLVARSRTYVDSAHETPISTIAETKLHGDGDNDYGSEALEQQHAKTTIASHADVSADSPAVSVSCSVLVPVEVHNSNELQTTTVRNAPQSSVSDPAHRPRRLHTMQLSLSSEALPLDTSQDSSFPRRYESNRRSDHDNSKRHHLHRSLKRSTRSSGIFYSRDIRPRSGSLKLRTSAKPTLKSKGSVSAVGATAGAFHSADSSPSTAISNSRVRSSPSPPTCASTARARIYRCDSQGTISSVEMSEYDLQHNVPILPLELTSNVIVGPALPLCGSIQHSSPQLPLSFLSHSQHQSRRASPNRRCCCSDRATCKVVFRQPQIDLNQMVLVPFDPDSWIGPVLKPRSALSSAELVLTKATQTGDKLDSSATNRFQSSLDSPEYHSVFLTRCTALRHPSESTDKVSHPSDGGEALETDPSKKMMDKLLRSMPLMHTYDVARPSSTSTKCSTTALSSRERYSYPIVPSISLNDRASTSFESRRSGVYADLALQIPLNNSADGNSPLTRSVTHPPQPITDTPIEPELSNSFLNKVYESDISSCSTAYESVVEFLDPVDGAPSKQKTGRKVYEDAAALYRYLANIKQRASYDAACENPAAIDIPLCAPAQQSKDMR